jgi:MFS family permease
VNNSTDEQPEIGLDPDSVKTIPPAKLLERKGNTHRLSTKQTFASFAHRNYRLWFFGQAASLIGTWMQTTAQGFLVYQLTHSPAYLGYIGFASGAPTLLFTLFGGVISDRMSRRNLMVITQTCMMLLAFILAGLTFLKLVQPWHIVVLAFLLGIANAFDAPSRQAFVVELVDRENLGNAVALNAMMFNLGTAIGPAVAGLVYALFGPAWCFTVNGISFIAVIVALIMMRLEPLIEQVRKGTAFSDLKDGLNFVIHHPVIRVLVLSAMVVTLFGMSFATILPAWAVTILHGDSTTNGFLQSARGVGALAGALFIASLGRMKFKGKVLTAGTVFFPGLILVWSIIRGLSLSMLVLVGVGFTMTLVMNMLNILVQSHVPDQLRGRVMGIYTFGFFGMMPVGALLAGSLAEWIGEPLTVAIGAFITLAFAGFLLIRMPYIRKLE